MPRCHVWLAESPEVAVGVDRLILRITADGVLSETLDRDLRARARVRLVRRAIDRTKDVSHPARPGGRRSVDELGAGCRHRVGRSGQLQVDRRVVDVVRLARGADVGWTRRILGTQLKRENAVGEGPSIDRLIHRLRRGTLSPARLIVGCRRALIHLTVDGRAHRAHPRVVVGLKRDRPATPDPGVGLVPEVVAQRDDIRRGVVLGGQLDAAGRQALGRPHQPAASAARNA